MKKVVIRGKEYYCFESEEVDLQKQLSCVLSKIHSLEEFTHTYVVEAKDRDIEFFKQLIDEHFKLCDESEELFRRVYSWIQKEDPGFEPPARMAYDFLLQALTVENI